jgi:hypothetical protein
MRRYLRDAELLFGVQGPPPPFVLHESCYCEGCKERHAVILVCEVAKPSAVNNSISMAALLSVIARMLRDNGGC